VCATVALLSLSALVRASCSLSEARARLVCARVYVGYAGSL
jgi:hypothetical protein